MIAVAIDPAHAFRPTSNKGSFAPWGCAPYLRHLAAEQRGEIVLLIGEDLMIRSDTHPEFAAEVERLVSPFPLSPAPWATSSSVPPYATRAEQVAVLLNGVVVQPSDPRRRIAY